VRLGTTYLAFAAAHRVRWRALFEHRIVWPRVDGQHLFHRGHDGAVGLRRELKHAKAINLASFSPPKIGGMAGLAGCLPAIVPSVVGASGRNRIIKSFQNG
jgi:hypothetical protein